MILLSTLREGVSPYVTRRTVPVFTRLFFVVVAFVSSDAVVDADVEVDLDIKLDISFTC